MKKRKVIGVLALQGAFSLHRPHIESLNSIYKEVSTSEDLKRCDALIIPGGESSTMLKLIDYLNLEKDLSCFFASRPTWGICAGSIILAKSVRCPTQKSFGVIDIQVLRNGYGSQINSREKIINEYKVSFIRAPILSKVNNDIEVIEHYGEKNPVFIKQKNIMITTFHPELNYRTPSPWHSYFVTKLLYPKHKFRDIS